MNFARALIRDLVDKRLWPVALLLVAALIAVPLLLGGGGAADEGVSLPAAAIDEGTTANASQPAVQLVGPASVRERAGKVRDPFRRKPKVLKTVAAAGAASSTASTPTDTSTDKSADKPHAADDKTKPDSDTTKHDPDKTKPDPDKTKPDPDKTKHDPDKTKPDTDTDTDTVVRSFSYRTLVRFGSTDGDGGRAHAISRLTPLGGVAEPALLYLGVAAGGTYATFLLGPNAHHSGEGKCTDKSCRIVGLKAGMSAVVDVTPAAGPRRQYALDVADVERDETRSARVGSRARAHVHPDGRDVLRDVIRDGATAQAVGRLIFIQSLGVVAARDPAADPPAGSTPLSG